ncbi:S-adenosyl-L-methionine-dependent methyltransferase [Pavlovales sp. CCMP2436]|nr:S-adenosyl-L-methionine-dependent methyltransferase [Pavlovales sp. CCMP2436]
MYIIGSFVYVCMYVYVCNICIYLHIYNTVCPNKTITNYNVVNLHALNRSQMNTVCQKLLVQPGDKLLDIGCGWGTLARHAAKHHGATSYGITLSKEGQKWCEAKNKLEKLGEKVKILFGDYREQDTAWGLFMSKYIFPGADASTPCNWYVKELEKAGFEVASVETIGRQYSHTIRYWYTNFVTELAKGELRNKYPAFLINLWVFFLGWSVVASGYGSVSCYQFVAHKNTYTFPRDQLIRTEPIKDAPFSMPAKKADSFPE